MEILGACALGWASDPTRRSAQTLRSLAACEVAQDKLWGARWLQIVVYLYVAIFSGFYIGVMAAAKPQPGEAAATERVYQFLVWGGWV